MFQSGKKVLTMLVWFMISGCSDASKLTTINTIHTHVKSTVLICSAIVYFLLVKIVSVFLFVIHLVLHYTLYSVVIVD